MQYQLFSEVLTVKNNLHKSRPSSCLRHVPNNITEKVQLFVLCFLNKFRKGTKGISANVICCIIITLFISWGSLCIKTRTLEHKQSRCWRFLVCLLLHTKWRCTMYSHAIFGFSYWVCVACWHSSTGSRIHLTHLRPPALPGDWPVTHFAVTHHSWQRHKVRARCCINSSNIITKTHP